MTDGSDAVCGVGEWVGVYVLWFCIVEFLADDGEV